MTTTYRALICDLDGTLVDSEPMHADAWLAVLADQGLQFDHAWFEQWIGTSDSYLASATIEKHGLDTTVAALQIDKQRRYHATVLRDLQAIAGVKEQLEKLRAAVPIAIATNSSRLDADHVFQATQLDQYVDASVTADDVAELKPAPDIYLLAAKQLGVDPQHCIAIEDSPAGATAARRAGMYVLGLDTSPIADQLTDAHVRYADSVTALTAVQSMIGK